MLPLAIISLFTLAGFAFGLYETYANSALAYFITPARIWELSLGGIIVFLPVILHRDLRLLLPWLGVVAILFAYIFFDGNDFPGWHALIPVIGTALVIWAGSSNGGSLAASDEQDAALAPSTFSVANLSRLRPIQFTGDISYSLYLYHWPLVVLVPFVLGANMNQGATLLKIVIFVSSFALAALSYYLVETPTRRWQPKRRPVAKVWLSGAVCMALVLCPAQLTEFHAKDFEDNILQIAYARGEDPADIGFGARATLHADELGYNPFGQVDSNWAQFGGNVYFSGVKADPTGSWRYSAEVGATQPVDLVAEFGDINASKTILVIGDSLSEMWYPAIDIAARNLGYKVIAANCIRSAGALYALDDTYDDSFKQNAQITSSVKRTNSRYQWIKDNLWDKADIVIVGISSFPFYPKEDNPGFPANAAKRLADTFHELQTLTGHKPILLQASPWITDLESKQQYLNSLNNIYPSADLIGYMNRAYDCLDKIGEADSCTYLKVEPILFDADGNVHTQIGGIPVYRDTMHVNSLYSISAGEYFLVELERIMAA